MPGRVCVCVQHAEIMQLKDDIRRRDEDIEKYTREIALRIEGYAYPPFPPLRALPHCVCARPLPCAQIWCDVGDRKAAGNATGLR